MKVYIDDIGRRVYIDPASCPPDDAYFMGVRLGREYAELSLEWSVYILPVPLCPRPWREARINGATSLVGAIRDGPPCTHSCSRHSEVKG